MSRDCQSGSDGFESKTGSGGGGCSTQSGVMVERTVNNPRRIVERWWSVCEQSSMEVINVDPSSGAPSGNLMRYQPLRSSWAASRLSLAVVPCGWHSDPGQRFITQGTWGSLLVQRRRASARPSLGTWRRSRSGAPRAAQLDGCDAGRPAASERISHEIVRLGEVLDQPPHAVEGLLKRVDLLIGAVEITLREGEGHRRQLGKVMRPACTRRVDQALAVLPADSSSTSQLSWNWPEVANRRL